MDTDIKIQLDANLSIRTWTVHAIIVISIHGSIDMHSGPRLKHWLLHDPVSVDKSENEDLLRFRCVAFEFSECRRISSGGIAALVQGINFLQKKGYKVVFVALTPDNQVILDLIGLTRYLPCFAKLADIPSSKEV